MKILQVLILLIIIPIEASAQPDSIRNIDNLEIELSFFDRQELKQINPNKINVIRHIYYDNKIVRTDTVFQAFFNKGKIVEEISVKPSIPSDSIHTKYIYNKNILTSTESFHRDLYEDTVIIKKKFDLNGLIIKEEQMQSNNLKRKFFSYDSHKRIDIIEIPSRNLKYKHYYDSLGRLERMVELHSAEDKLDSIINRYLYDSNGNIIKKSRLLSKTYRTTFELDCLTGFGTEYFSFDTLNRLIVIGNKEIFQDPPQKDKWGFVYSRIAYEEIKYLENGILFEIYNSNNQLQESKLYYKYRHENKQVEVYEDKSKVTYFLHEDSKLPKRIDISSDVILIYEFEYLK